MPKDQRPGAPARAGNSPPAPGDPGGRVAAALAVEARLRELLPEAHGTVKDLRRAMDQQRELLTAHRIAANQAMGDGGEAIRAVIDEVAERESAAIREMYKDAERAVMGQVRRVQDHLAELAGAGTMAELVRELAEVLLQQMMPMLADATGDALTAAITHQPTAAKMFGGNVPDFGPVIVGKVRVKLARARDETGAGQ